MMNRPGPARPNPALTLFDALFLIRFKINSLQGIGVSWAMRSELEVESFFPQSYGKPKQSDIWEAIDFFFDIAHETKKNLF